MGGVLPDLAGPRGGGAPSGSRSRRRSAPHDRPRSSRARRPPHPHDARRTASPTSSRSSSTSRRRRPRRDRDHRPRADRRGARGAVDGPRPRAADRGRRRRGGHDARRAPARAVDRAADPAIPLARARRSPTSTRRAVSRSPPIRWCPTRCAPRAGCCDGCWTTRTRPSVPTRSRRSTRRRSADRGTIVSCASPISSASRMSATATPTPSRPIGTGWTTFPGRTADDLRRGDRGRHDRARRLVPRRDRAGRRVRPAAPQARPRRPRRGGGRVRRDGTGRDHGYPGGRARPPRSIRRPAARPARDGPTVKIGLVCPYIYPANGGVAQHVRFLYEDLRLRGHDVRILTASHGPQRASEGDIIRLGVGLVGPDQRVGRDAHVLAALPAARSATCSIASGSTSSTSTSRSCRSCRCSSCASRRSVNIATFHAYAGFSPSYEFGSRALRGHATRLHGRIAVSAAARHFIDRFFPGDYKVIPNGVDVGRFANAVPIARWQDGTPNVLFVGRHEPRKGLLDLLKAHRILRKTGSGSPAADRRQRAAGARGAALRRDARPAGRRVPRPRVATRRRPSSSGPRTSTPRRRPAASRSGSSCSRRWPPGTPIVASDIHGYKGVVRRGREGLLVPPREPRELADRDRPAAARPGAARADGRRRAGARRGVQLAAGHGQGRGLLRLRDPAPGRDAARCRPASGPRCLRRRRRCAPGPPARRQSRRRRPSRPEPLPEPALARDLGERQPPDRGRVGDDQAGHGDRAPRGPRRPGSTSVRRPAAPRCSPGTGTRRGRSGGGPGRR